VQLLCVCAHNIKNCNLHLCRSYRRLLCFALQKTRQSKIENIKMPFLAQKHLPISNKDLLSWIFDQPDYDLDTPVSGPVQRKLLPCS
jgi:hypothetical protein